MGVAKPVRQQWLFDGGLTDGGRLSSWCGRDVGCIPNVGSPRDLLDGDGLLIRKVSLSYLERTTLGADGEVAMARELEQPNLGTILIVDDRPRSANPTIAVYAEAVRRGIVAACDRLGYKTYVVSGPK